MTKRTKLFISYYVQCKNGTEAAKKAGFSAKSAHAQASRLLKNAEVKAEIDSLINKSFDAACITLEYILEGLKEVAQRCMQRSPVMVRDGKKMVQAQEYVEDPATGEEVLADVWQFDSQGANKALELLGKYKKMFTDKTEIAGLDNLADAIRAARLRSGKLEPPPKSLK